MSTKFAFDLQIHVMLVFDFATNSYLYEYECVSNDLPSSEIGLTFESTIVLSWSLRADGTKNDVPGGTPLVTHLRSFIYT